MNEIIKTSDAAMQEIKRFTGFQPKGGTAFVKKVGDFVTNEEITLFVPWAAPATGRTNLTESDTATLDWLFKDNGLVERLGRFGSVTCLMMFADTYAQRNKFNMSSANIYWSNVSNYISTEATFTSASLLEDENMLGARKKESYAFEKLLKPQQKRILQAAARYSGAEGSSAIYESAAEYSMYRAGEARYVGEVLDALWVSLNWPERDIMCGEAPRIYIPEVLRAPWLKES